jgi:trigger factor
VRTEVEQLGDNRVRLTVEVPSHDVRHAVDHAVSDLSASVRIPGFRRGKVPTPVLIQRVGRERVYGEAVESHIGGWFRSAAARSRIRPVEQPEYVYELPASSDAPWEFQATVGVQPLPEPADWTQLEVPYAEPQVPEEAVSAELEVLQRSVAELVPVDDRPAHEGDTLVLDVTSPSGEVNRDVVVELGGQQLLPELEEKVAGMAPGEERALTYTGADGEEQQVKVALRELKEKVLPPLDDELARASSEFDTLAELRGAIEGRLREELEGEAEGELRAAAVDALVDASKVDAAGPLVEQRAAELWNGLLRSLERRGISPEMYMRITGLDGQELVSRTREQAQRSVARELVLDAVAEKLELDVSDDELREFIREQAGEDEADEAIEELFTHGGAEALREDLRLRKALDRVASEVKRIAPDLAAAREKLWTPEKDKPATETKLWTPGSKETV